ncbi:sulfite exporter TauE/SafE family protein [uncultured Paraglaciecola sp.]|uniref:sulfite exporter TauE/SafE family protein n=1 Tax=uncultured Paraglaciecola sp. TaxID=1765024 RepID=UPI0030DD1F49|tara:strand:- start:27098 stop:27841 length:744 start_codon:yes stop_codon:yes gene_type:complete
MLIVLIGASFIGLSLGILGSGGAILTVPMLIYGLGYSEKVAIASALVIVGTISATTALIGIKRKMVNWTLVIYFGGPSMISAYIGAWGSNFVSGSTQVIVLAMVMLTAAWKIFRTLQVQPTNKLNRLLTVLQGIGVGLLTGFVGVGGGFLIVPALVLLGGIVMSQAIFTSLLIIAINSGSGFIKYHAILQENNQLLDWPTIILISLIGIAGSVIGQYFAMKLPQQKIKNAFGVFLTIMAIFIFSQNY